MKITKHILLTILCLFLYGNLQAIPAYPLPKVVKQSDGTTITVIKKGDEYFHYHETIDGYLISSNKEGIFYYAHINSNGNVRKTSVKAKDPSFRDQKEKNFIKQIDRKQQQNTLKKMIPVKRTKSFQKIKKKNIAHFPKVGSPRSLVILVNFSDKTFSVPNPQTAFTNLLNQEDYSENGGTGSARDYFRDNSMGTFVPQFDVVGPYNLPHDLAYYGENDESGFDKRAAEMIVDACRLADEAGLDFTIYDTDNDNYIDNVFVYYAGYNEAEWGGDDTVWPHRWGVYPNSEYGDYGNYDGDAESITFDGKKVFDYACTSELKDSQGLNMAGIGTFTHEFGHVLGLADMYPTDGSDHHTLSDWCIMDIGAYLNEGRTPPAYNAFERFQLGFMTPTLLIEDVDLRLEPLINSNEAYLVSPTDSHNLIGNNPSPKEFFLLENRQKVGWDAYLPGEGMLVYRINYDENNFWDNVPNNDPDAMAVDLIEADGIANNRSFKGDPFPGKTGRDSLSLILTSNEKTYRTVYDITEDGQDITFSLRKEKFIETNLDSISFLIPLNSTYQAKELKITTKNITDTIYYELIGEDVDFFTVSGNGKLPVNGGGVFVNFTATEEGVKKAQLKIWSGELIKYIHLTGSTPVIPLDTPKVPEDISSILVASDGFTAQWEPVERAESYLINIYTKSYVNEEKIVLEENFDTFTDGETNNQVSSKDVSLSLDDYMGQPGWSGKKIFEAGGAIKLGSSSKYGSLTTPTLDLSGNNGEFLVEFDAMAWNNDSQELSIYQNDNLVYEIKNLNNQTYEFNRYSILFTNGTGETKISIESSGLYKSRFFLDNFIIKQGKKLVRKDVDVEGSPFSSANTNYEYYDVTENNVDYYYTVKAVRGEQVSKSSMEVGPIKLLPSTSDTQVLSQNLKIMVVNNQLIITAKDGESIEIYNTVGQKLIHKRATDGANRINLPKSGIFIVKVGDNISKVII